MRDTGRRLRLPALIRFLAGHCALGVIAGLATAALLLWLDIGGLGGLVAGDGAGRWIAIGLLGFGFAITFGSLAMGSALFLLPRDDAPDDDSPLRADQVPVRSAARTRARWKV